MSNAGKWDRWYAMLGDQPEPYADTETYAAAAKWLEPCSLVEDWGCGKGWMRKFIPADRYRGIDGSNSLQLALHRSSHRPHRIRE